MAMTGRRTLLGWTVAAVTAATSLPAAVAGAEALRVEPAAPITAMTRNVYLGADITRPVRATAGKTGPAALVALGHANHEVRTIVERTSFPTRSALLAGEIARAKPDLVGLQEVALWRSGPLELGQLGVPNATTVDYDFLEILLSDLRRLGARYAPARVQQAADVEGPAFLGSPFDGSLIQGRDVRLTVRDVILVRETDNLRVLASGGGQFRARLDLSLGGVPFSVVRSHAWVDVGKGAAEMRFISTHLESASSDLALAQATELLGGPARHTGRLILGCDCNSDPLNHTIRPGDRVPHSAAYTALTRTGGFTDLWLHQRHPNGPGWTFGLGELVNDPTAAGFDHRIDMIFARTIPDTRIAVRQSEVTGDELADRDPATGLWPSDHAGLVVALNQLPPGP